MLILAILLIEAALAKPVWIPSKPSQIKAEIKVDDGKVNICVKMMFPHTGFKVDWKSFNLNGNVVEIYVEVYEGTGVTCPVIIEKSQEYSISGLTPGKYVLKIYVNRELLYEKTFTVEQEEPLSTWIYLAIFAATIVVGLVLKRRQVN